MTHVMTHAGEMPTRAMNDPSPLQAAQSIMPQAAQSEMATRDMNALAPAPVAVPGDSPREREKLAAYRRENAESEALLGRSMPGQGMGQA